MMEVFEDIEQGTEQWFRIRAAIPTASMFKTVLASAQDAGESKTRRSYMLRLAGERITGEPAETYSNWHMERGKALEPEARNLFAFMHDVEPVQIGFIRNGQKGCSPDSLISDRGLLEIKTALPHILIDHILNDRFPPEHRAQVQGQLWIAEREYNDLMIYWPGLPPFIKRTARDEKFITKLSHAVAQFNEEIESVVERIRSYGGQDAIAGGSSMSEQLAFEDPDHEGNSAAYRTGKTCIEKGCDRPAGTKWSPHWCFECNVDRIKRISASLEALI